MDLYYTGQIVLFAGPYAPAFFLPCDGRTMSISEYPELFSLIGATYGGDAKTQFNLPDLRSRVALGFGQGWVDPKNGGGGQLTAHALGGKGGTETVSLAAAQLPMHTHIFNTVNADASTNSPNGSMLAKVPSDAAFYLTAKSGDPTPTVLELGDQAVTNAGSNIPHTNVMPTLPLSYLICIQGIYPNFS